MDFPVLSLSRLLSHKYANHVCDEKVVEELVSWNRQPQFSRPGRSASFTLGQPCIGLNHFSQNIRSLKLKGVGVLTHSGQVMQPSSLRIENRHPHLGFDNTGEIILLNSTPAPMGGITRSRAVQEFRVAERLILFGCPCITPLFVYSYDLSNVGFGQCSESQEEFGAVISGVPNTYDIRADSVFDYPHLDEARLHIVDHWSNSLGSGNPLDALSGLISKLAHGLGFTIRKFSEAGCYRYSCSPDNYSINPDTGTIFLLDLDSSLFLQDIDSEIQRGLQVCRDSLSGLGYLIANLTKPSRLDYLPAKDVSNSKTLLSYLCGYYHDVSLNRLVDIAKATEIYYEYVLAQKHMGEDLVNTSPPPSSTFASRDYFERMFERPWINRLETYSCLLPIVYTLHKSSQMNQLYPLNVSLDHLLNSISNFTDISLARTIQKICESA
jgi:hypothetical protein